MASPVDPRYAMARPLATAALLLAGIVCAACARPGGEPAAEASTAPPAETPATSPAARDAIDASTSAILKGDSEAALEALRAVPAAQFAGEDATYRTCMLDRFARTDPPEASRVAREAFADEVFATYQRYWWQALAAPSRREALDARLERDLRALLGERGAAAADMDAVEAALTDALEQRGFHAQLGRTPPLRELMLWRDQQTRHYQVELPEGPESVDVELLDDFVSMGWSAWARCGRGSAGGWATDEKLFAIVPAYEDDGGLGSETFRVVFLGHEAQHFADQNRYPGLQPWELEYRAKLVELAQARTVGAKRLRGFVTAQGDDPDSPHTYANKRVVAALARRLGRRPEAVPLRELQAAARAELLADSARRRTDDAR